MSNDETILDLMAAFDVGFQGSPVEEAGAELLEEGQTYRLIRKGERLYRVSVEAALPANVTLSKDQASAPLTRAEAHGPDQMRYNRPELEGIQAQIQHPVQSGKPPTDQPGMLGCGMIKTDDGWRFMVQMKHPDGTSLGAILFPRDYVDFGHIYGSLGVRAGLISATAGQRPS